MSSPPVIAPTPETTPGPRLTSLDAFRGFTMLLMASEIARLPRALLQTYPGNGVAFFVADMLEHREWVGVTPWDLIQPSFMFMVGVALPFSVASRRERGHAFGRLFGHAVLRSLILILLGIFLRSQGRPQTYFTFEDVLTQIGLGYPFLFLLAWTRPRWQAVAAVAILIGYWAAFALYPLPPPGFDWTSVGVPADWPHHLSGFAAHWDKNANLAHAADVWFLNLFPRESPFRFNGGGYLTLNFVPSLATMIFGLLAGGLRQGRAAGAGHGVAARRVGRRRHRPRPAAACRRRVPAGQAHLDAVVGRLQRRLGRAVPGRLVRGDRPARLDPRRLPVPRGRRELDRDVRHRPRRRPLHDGRAAHPPRHGAVRDGSGRRSCRC